MILPCGVAAFVRASSYTMSHCRTPVDLRIRLTGCTKAKPEKAKARYTVESRAGLLSETRVDTGAASVFILPQRRTRDAYIRSPYMDYFKDAAAICWICFNLELIVRYAADRLNVGKGN